MSFLKKILVNQDFSDSIRLDRFLKKKFPWLNKALIERLLREKKVLVNGKKAEGKLRIISGDQIDLFTDLDSYVKDFKPKQMLQDISYKDFFESLVIWEDENICVINKPYGLCSQGGTGNLEHLDMIIKQYNQEYRLVHRLDKQTSGIMLIAKSYQSALFLTQQFKENLIEKTYLAVLDNPLPDGSGTINIPIGKDFSSAKEKMLAFANKSKTAITNYKTITNFNDGTSFVELKPETGRTHQLRVHASYLGSPIVGDNKYGSKIKNKLHLHAYKIVLSIKNMQNKLTFVAPLSDHILNTIKKNDIDWEILYEKFCRQSSH